jgi:hypothetical protein
MKIVISTRENHIWTRFKVNIPYESEALIEPTFQAAV